MSPSLEARAPGKVVLVGEYAVLDGCVGIVTAVDRFAKASARPGTGVAPGACTVTSGALGLVQAVLMRGSDGAIVSTDPLWSTPRAGLVRAFLDHAWPGSTALPDVALELDTRAFAADHDPERKLGLGSSAAIAVALAALAARLRSPDTALDRGSIFAEALAAHDAAQHGAGSGIDLAASTWGGVLAYRRPAGPTLQPTLLRRLEWPRGVELLVIDTGQPASTTELVSVVQRHREAPAVAAVLAKLAETSDHAVAALARADHRALFQLVSAYGRGMAELGAACGVDIVSAAHQRAERVVTLKGGVYKPSGAGGGDVGIALASSTAQRDELASDLVRAGFGLLDVNRCATGVAFAGEGPSDV